MLIFPIVPVLRVVRVVDSLDDVQFWPPPPLFSANCQFGAKFSLSNFTKLKYSTSVSRGLRVKCLETPKEPDPHSSSGGVIYLGLKRNVHIEMEMKPL